MILRSRPLALREEWAMDSYAIVMIVVSALCIARMYVIFKSG